MYKKKTRVYVTFIGRNGERSEPIEIRNHIRYTEDGIEVVDWDGNVLSKEKSKKNMLDIKAGKGEAICLDENGDRVFHQEERNYL